MTLLAAILLLAAATSSELMDEVHQVPAGDWKFIEVSLHRQPARISAYYQVLSGSTKVRAALMLRDDLDRMSGDLPGAIIQTDEGRSGAFTDNVRRRGEYVVVLDNGDGKEAATVRVKVALDFNSGSEVWQLTAQRRLTVIVLSFGVFFGIVGISARKLLSAIRH